MLKSSTMYFDFFFFGGGVGGRPMPPPPPPTGYDLGIHPGFITVYVLLPVTYLESSSTAWITVVFYILL
jgi:hypothetical protein